MLIRNNLHELFPAPEVFNKGLLTLITLSYKDDTENEQGAKNVWKNKQNQPNSNFNTISIHIIF